MAEPPEAPAPPGTPRPSRMRRPADGGLRPLTADRFAGLSDTVFGVAMTLLATTLVPQAEQLNGSAVEMLHAMAEPLSAVALSFAVAAIYWISQQRRLSMLELLSPRQMALHLGFLFLIMLLPISTGIYARRQAAAAPVAIYGLHVTLISAVNLALWLDVHRRVAVWLAVVPSTAAVVILGGGCAVGLFYPGAAQYVWYAALAIPLVTRSAQRAVLYIGRRDDRE